MRETLRRRKALESGHQILEFALVAFMFIPLFMGTFVTGMNVIRSIQANHIARDMTNMYIHGTDFSDPAMQRVAKKLASGLDLQIGTGSTNVADNISNGGRGIVWVSKVMWVGATTAPNCQSVLPATCTNTNKFVFMEQIRFGNGTLETERDTSVGHPSAARNEYGQVTVDYIKTASAALPEPQQTAMRNLWQVAEPTTTTRQPLADGQVLYMVEVYFQSPDLTLGSFQGGGVYSRWFF